MLNFLTISSSSFETRPNFTVLLNTVSLDRAFQIVGAPFLSVKRITFGFAGSVVMKLSTLSLLTLMVKSGMNLEILPTRAFISSLPSYLNAGMGLVGYTMIAGVSSIPCFLQKTGNSVQLRAQTLAMPFRSPATVLYVSRNATSALLSSWKNHRALTALSRNLPMTPSKLAMLISWMSCFIALISTLAPRAPPREAAARAQSSSVRRDGADEFIVRGQEGPERAKTPRCYGRTAAAAVC
mmetsp:Transcript_19233/g.50796  ORF Transcript_19233/g.50796 Transcript_19233/m.50796 type:complete len:239 (+) Transcript_19233:762-1478(+)